MESTESVERNRDCEPKFIPESFMTTPPEVGMPEEFVNEEAEGARYLNPIFAESWLPAESQTR